MQLHGILQEKQNHQSSWWFITQKIEVRMAHKLCEIRRKLWTDFTLPKGSALRRKTFRDNVLGSPTTIYENENCRDAGCTAHCLYALFKSKLLANQAWPPSAWHMTALTIAATTSSVWGFGLSLGWDAALIPDQEKSSTHQIFPLCLTPKRLLSGKCGGTSFRSKGPSASPPATSCNVWSQTECAISESKKTTCPYERPSLCSLAWLGNAALLLSL